MAALNFVAVEDGLEESPKIGTLSRMLRVKKSDAVWFVIRLRRMVLNHGNHITGSIPRQFTDEDIASFLDFDGRAKALIVQLKRQGYLVRKAGRGYFYPDWENTITGRYASQRERDRLWHERDRKNRRSNDVGRQSNDTSADSRTTSSDIQTGRKEGRKSADTPLSAPQGGPSQGASRWDWLMENAPTPQNRGVCTRFLDAMSAADWELVQFAYTVRQKGASNISQKNARTLAWPTDVFLRKTAFLRFAGYLRTFKNASSEAASKAKTEPQTSPEDLVRNAWLFLQDTLSRPKTTAEQAARMKEDFHKQWKCKPWEGEQPWEQKAAAKAKPTTHERKRR
jgi:hypothetical protein